jgi:hypothetical protein
MLIAIGCANPQDDIQVSVPDGFNPFNDNFELHSNIKLSQYDTMLGECGFWHLAKSEDGLYTFYQLFGDEPKIWAKGFRLDIDEVVSDIDRSAMNLETVKNLFYKVPFDTSQVRKRLSKIGIVNFRILSDTAVMCKIELIDSDSNTFDGWIQAFPIPDDKRVIRYIDFYKRPKD